MDSSPGPSPDSGVSGSTIKADSSSGVDVKNKKSVSGGVWKVASPLSILTNNKVGSSFSGHQEQALINYNQQQQLRLQAALTLPVASRRVRDSSSLLFMLAFLGFLGYVIWDGIFIKQTDINLIVHGHDSYGNICGRENRPIKFVEKSGKNYSSKPFTKYTLINAQFERYTLDSDKLRHGELFYIKQLNEAPPDRRLYSANGSSSGGGGLEYNGVFEYARNSRLRSVVGPRASDAGILVSESAVGRLRTKRDSNSLMVAAPLLTGELLAASKRNQTLLRQLKSSLMYQYPQLYGYNNPPQADESSVAAAVANSRRGASNLASPSLLAAFKRKQDQSKETQGVGVSNFSAQPPSNQLTSRSGDVYGATANATAAASNTHQVSIDRASSTRANTSSADLPRTVHFDDQLNETDRYDHMLIAPSNTNNNLRPRRPDGFYANEVGSQLLYLTECVDYCPPDHVELIFYRCMPKNWRFSLFPNAINVTRTFIDDIFTDMTHCYKELIYIFSLALVLSLGLLILLRFLASLIIWSCLMLLVGLSLSMASYAWLNYYYLILDLNNSLPNNSVYSEKLTTSDKWLIGAIFLTFVTFAAVAMILFMRKRILMVTMLFRESGKAIADMPLLLLQPVLTFATLVTITALWSMGLICLQSVKSPSIDMSTGFVIFKSETLYKIMKWYHIFAFLWISHFAIACQHYVIGASVSKWYFSTDRYNLHSPIGSSVSELILYYLGSVALGSFLVAIFKVIKIVVRQIQYLVQRNCMQPHDQPGGSSNGTSTITGGGSSLVGPQIQASTSWCGSFTYLWRVFIWFFDNIVMIINRDAYVEVAIHGHSFLKGAQRALAVLASNPLRLLAIKSVGSILLVVAKVCVVFGTISMAIVLIDDKTHQLNYSWSPIVVSALFAYVVAHWFLSVYEMVIDALFICYCEDYERSKAIEAAASSPINGSNFMAQILNSGQIY